MILAAVKVIEILGRIPRMSGDDPLFVQPHVPIGLYSPHERG